MCTVNNAQSRFWCGTDYELARDYTNLGIEYGVYQRERCPESGREHVQFHFEWSERKRFSQVQKLLPKAHIERVRDVDKSRSYAQKEESRVDGPFFIGEIGKRKQVVDVVSELKKRRAIDVVCEHTSLWWRLHSMQRLECALQARNVRTTRTELFYVYGKTGCGKTMMASRFGKLLSTYWHQGDKWWDGYMQQDLVIVDEFHGQCFDNRLLLKLGDYTPLQLQTKGGQVQFNSVAVIFLSNLPPEDTIFLGKDEVVDALKRRFRVINYGA